MNTEILKYTTPPTDITKRFDLILKVKIDNTGWTLITSSALACVPDRRTCRYSIGNNAQVNQRGHSVNDSATLQDIHVFVIESFRQLATIYSQFTATCEYTLTFLDNDIHVSFSESLKKTTWEGIITPGEECVPNSDGPAPHPMLFENFETDILDDIFQSINRERFDSASPVESDDNYSYAM